MPGFTKASVAVIVNTVSDPPEGSSRKWSHTAQTGPKSWEVGACELAGVCWAQGCSLFRVSLFHTMESPRGQGQEPGQI
jgi:hypothetical protein